METRQEIVERIRANPWGWLLCSVGLLIPSLGALVDRYFGGPYGDPSWFTPLFNVLFVLGVLCCIAAPFFGAAPFRRRLALLGLAVFGYIAANVVALILVYLIFGPEKDWERRQDAPPIPAARASSGRLRAINVNSFRTASAQFLLQLSGLDSKTLDRATFRRSDGGS